MSMSTGFSVPLFDLAADLRAYLPQVEPDLDAFHTVVRGDWSMDEVIVFAYLVGVRDYNVMLTRFVADNGADLASVRQLTAAIRAAVGSRFTVERKD